MKIFMLSYIDRIGNNKKLYKEILKNNPKVCYIPSWKTNEVAKDYSDFKKSVKKDVEKVSFIPVDKKMTKKSMNDLLESDVIFIDGGNTFFLMKKMRKNGYFNLLKKMKNKIFVGISAGAIALTKNINLAQIPEETGDDNFVNLKNKKGLGFVNFEFHAHATGSRQENIELEKYSKKFRNKIYLCKDGQGIKVSGNKVFFNGKIKEINKGKIKNQSAGGAK